MASDMSLCQNSVGDLRNGTIIRDNSAGDGGGIYVVDAIALVADSVIESNFAQVCPWSPALPYLSGYIEKLFIRFWNFHNPLARMAVLEVVQLIQSPSFYPALWRCSGDCRFSAT